MSAFCGGRNWAFGRKVTGMIVADGPGQPAGTPPEGAVGGFAWSDALSVGIAAIDDDHKAFFELAGLLHSAQAAGGEYSVVDSALSMLEEYILGHFLREEKAMAAVGYPRLAEHQEAHRRFRDKAHAVVEAHRQGVQGAELPSLVDSWLRQHIARNDKAYENWISAAAVDSRPLVFLAMEAEDAESGEN